jgi:phospholipase/carboxylesterase
MTDLLPAIEIDPPGEVRASLIWLHGLGADGSDFAPIVPMLPLTERGVRVILPHAPSIPVSLNGGFVMPAWYDIRSGDLRQRNDEAGIRHSAEQIEAWIEAERARGVERVGLAGFSQGGAVALHVGLRQPQPLACVIALSTYLVLEEALEEEANPAAQSTPMFQAHGALDPMVPIARGRAARDWLVARDYPLTWHEERVMQHEVTPGELRALGAWLDGVFPA